MIREYNKFINKRIVLTGAPATGKSTIVSNECEPIEVIKADVDERIDFILNNI